MCTWAISLDPWPNRTWGCARICFFQFCTSTLRPSRPIVMAEIHVWAMFLTTDSQRAYFFIYVNMLKNKGHKISRIFRTNWQKSSCLYVHQHAHAEQTHIPLDLFAKDTACMRKKNYVSLLLDLSAKYTALKLMYVKTCMRVETHWLLNITLTYGNQSAFAYRLPYL